MPSALYNRGSHNGDEDLQHSDPNGRCPLPRHVLGGGYAHQDGGHHPARLLGTVGWHIRRSVRSPVTESRMSAVT